jgi:hypothetical protein
LVAAKWISAAQLDYWTVFEGCYLNVRPYNPFGVLSIRIGFSYSREFEEPIMVDSQKPEPVDDYVIFLHGVNTRREDYQPNYSQSLWDLMQAENREQRHLKRIELYWGDVGDAEEQALLQRYRRDERLWSQLCFSNIRENQLLRFTGDAALYLSRYTGIKVIERLRAQLGEGLSDYKEGDRLHLVTHSMGTIILFDVLFSGRWDPSAVNEYQGAQDIRDAIGLYNMRLCSIHTMGSPISVFQLMMEIPIGVPSDGIARSIPRTHDITPKFQEFLGEIRGKLGKPLPWRNYIHPGDPIASPLANVLPDMLDPGGQNLEIRDILTQEPDIFEAPLNMFGDLGEVAQLMLFGGAAHGSYWNSQLVSDQILKTIPIGQAIPIGP